MNIKIQNCLNGLIPFGIKNDNNNIDHHAALSPPMNRNFIYYLVRRK